MPRATKSKPRSRKDRVPVHLSIDVHAQLVEAAKARDCYLGRLADRLIREGLDRREPATA